MPYRIKPNNGKSELQKRTYYFWWNIITESEPGESVYSFLQRCKRQYNQKVIPIVNMKWLV
jgi:hypothetical protein